MAFKSKKPGYEEARSEFAQKERELIQARNEAERQLADLRADYLQKWRPWPVGQKLRITHPVFCGTLEKPEIKLQTSELFVSHTSATTQGEFAIVFMRAKKDGTPSSLREWQHFDGSEQIEEIE